MELERICIKNYRGKDFDIEPKKLNIFLGSNGSGKTSLCDAIRFGITGMSSSQVKETSVRIHYKNGLDTERIRSRTNAVKVNGHRTSEEAMNAAIAKACGLPIPQDEKQEKNKQKKRTDPLESIRIASSSEVLLHLKPEELSAFLFKYIPERLNADMVMNYFTTMSEELSLDCSLCFPPMPEEFDIEEIQNAFQYFYEERREANRILKTKEAHQNSLHPSEPSRTMEQIETELALVLYQENQARTEAAQMRTYQAAKQKREQQEAQIKNLEQQIPKEIPQAPNPEELEKFETAKEKAEKEKIKLIRNLETVKSNLDLFRRTMDSLEQTVCPISPKLICATDKTAIRAEIEKSIKSNEEMYYLCQTDINTMEEVIGYCIEGRRAYDEKKQNYERYENLMDQIKLYKENLTDVPEKPEPSVPAEQLAKKKQELITEKKNLEDYTRKKALEYDIERLKNRIKRYDYLVSALNDKGEVKSGIMERYLSMFAKICNLRAAQLAPGYEIRFTQENGIHILMKTPANKGFFPLEALSSGETMIAVFFITDLLNQLANTRLMFLDNVEALDQEALGNLRTLIRQPEFLDSYDHIFICGVNHTEVQKAFGEMDANYISVG